MGNQGIPAPQRRNCLSLAGLTYHRSKGDAAREKDDIVSFLLEQTENAKEETLRHGAAYALRNFVRLDDEQAARLEAIKAKSQDLKLNSIIAEALTRSGPPQR